MSNTITINSKVFDYQQLRSINLDKSKNSIPIIEYKTIKFCKDWLSGKKDFKINTSGATGKPKQISFTRDQMIASAEMTGKTFGLNRDDNALVCLSTNYIAGIMMLVRGFELGLDLTVISPTSNPLKDFPGNTKFDFAAFVPIQLQSIINETPEKINILDKMKAIIVGGAAVNPVLEQALQIIKAPVYSTYGMTETLTHIAIRRINGIERSEVYQTLDGVMIGTDKRNCLKIKSKITNNQWLITNDLVEISPPEKKKRGIGETERRKTKPQSFGRGRRFTDSPIHQFTNSVRNSGGWNLGGTGRGASCFKWLGRIDNIINSGGVKVLAEKVENALAMVFRKFNVDNRFFVTGLPHGILGEAISVIVEGTTFSTNLSDKINKQLNVLLSKYERPKDFYYLNKFRETPTGKIDRRRNIDFFCHKDTKTLNFF